LDFSEKDTYIVNPKTTIGKLVTIIRDAGEINCKELVEEYKKRYQEAISTRRIGAILKHPIDEGLIEHRNVVGIYGGVYFVPIEGKKPRRKTPELGGNMKLLRNMIEKHVALTLVEIKNMGAEIGLGRGLAQNAVNVLLEKKLILKYPPEVFSRMKYVVYYVDKKRIKTVKRLYLKKATIGGRLYELIKEFGSISVSNLASVYKRKWKTNLEAKIINNAMRVFVEKGFVESVRNNEDGRIGVYNLKKQKQ